MASQKIPTAAQSNSAKVSSSKAEPQADTLEVFLPVRRWQLGRHHFHQSSSLTFRQHTSYFTMRHPGSFSEVIRFGRDVENAEYTIHAPLCLTIMSRPDPQFETAVGLEYPDEYIPGDPSKGKITIEFNDKHSKWSRAKYDNFCRFLERNTGCQRQENRSTAINRGSDKSRLQPARQEGAQGDMDLQTTEVASEIILSFPANTQGAIQILAGDLARLNPGQYLNDNLIEFGLRLWYHELSPNLAAQLHLFNTFFYNKLKTPKSTIEQQFANIQRWTKHVDIFEKDFLVVPIHEQHHWYLAIVWQPGLMVNAESDEGKTTVTQILTLDSLGQKHPDVIGRLSEYLRLAGRDKMGSDVTMKPVGQQLCVPIQDNGCDCGIYMLHFVKTFATDPEFFSTLTKTKPDGKHLIDWHAKDLKTGRERLRKRILELSRLWQDVGTSKKAKGRKV